MNERDISDLLREWPWEPGRIQARLVVGADGRPKLQVRIHLGVLQMEMDGRPDGERPGGFESLLEQALDRRARGGSAEAFTLAPEACRELREEAVQYYHRYVGLMAPPGISASSTCAAIMPRPSPTAPCSSSSCRSSS
jgi:hypothetical protein